MTHGKPSANHAWNGGYLCSSLRLPGLGLSPDPLPSAPYSLQVPRSHLLQLTDLDSVHLLRENEWVLRKHIGKEFQDAPKYPRTQSQARPERVHYPLKIAGEWGGPGKHEGNCPKDQRTLGLYLKEGAKQSGVPSQALQRVLAVKEHAFPWGFSCRNCHGTTAGGDFPCLQC